MVMVRGVVTANVNEDGFARSAGDNGMLDIAERFMFGVAGTDSR